MQGLKTQEESGFCRFFELVQKSAAARGSVFFLDAGEGRDFEHGGMKGEDLSGWLIPAGRADAFQAEWEKGMPQDKWLEFFCFAIWSTESGALAVEFKQFD